MTTTSIFYLSFVYNASVAFLVILIQLYDAINNFYIAYILQEKPQSWTRLEVWKVWKT